MRYQRYEGGILTGRSRPSTPMTLLALSPSTSILPWSSMRTRSPPILARGPVGLDVKCFGSRGRWIRMVLGVVVVLAMNQPKVKSLDASREDHPEIVMRGVAQLSVTYHLRKQNEFLCSSASVTCTECVHLTLRSTTAYICRAWICSHVLTSELTRDRLAAGTATAPRRTSLTDLCLVFLLI